MYGLQCRGLHGCDADCDGRARPRLELLASRVERQHPRESGRRVDDMHPQHASVLVAFAPEIDHDPSLTQRRRESSEDPGQSSGCRRPRPIASGLGTGDHRESGETLGRGPVESFDGERRNEPTHERALENADGSLLPIREVDIQEPTGLPTEGWSSRLDPGDEVQHPGCVVEHYVRDPCERARDGVGEQAEDARAGSRTCADVR